MTRFDALLAWLAGPCGLPDSVPVPASSDASFRRYFRVDTSQGTRIVMDAPPEREDCRPFVHVAHLLREATGYRGGGRSGTTKYTRPALHCTVLRPFGW